MTLKILDTDHVSLALRGYRPIVDRLQHVGATSAITVITVQEIFDGWTARINAPDQQKNLVRNYTEFWRSIGFMKPIRILNFDDAANQHYDRLLHDDPSLRRKRLQKDLRIAAIALSLKATVVTRNVRDFSQVPDLLLENWMAE